MGQNRVILRRQKFTFPRVSGASERANGRASSPVLTSRLLFVPDHSALTFLAPNSVESLNRALMVERMVSSGACRYDNMGKNH